MTDLRVYWSRLRLMRCRGSFLIDYRILKNHMRAAGLRNGGAYV